MKRTIDEILIGFQCATDEYPGDDVCKNCSYKPYRYGECKRDAIGDALAILKGQTARVMPITDVQSLINQNVPVFFEFRYGISEATVGWRFVKAIKDLDGRRIYMLTNTEWNSAAYEQTYGNSWRCWDKKPTEEQRENSAWEG